MCIRDSLDVADTDKVGRLYNVMRKELGFLPNEDVYKRQGHVSACGDQPSQKLGDAV